MGKHDYSCPKCRKSDLTFLYIKESKVNFACNVCKDIFDTEGQGGYLPNKVTVLKKKYPLKTRPKVEKNEKK